ncbi:hypothetical protein VP277E431_P0110 [Vibrio phage 277E43-1]|nr:hypothetical protein VP277E431_P0110 [Vibrio phage 277E43-1]
MAVLIGEQRTRFYDGDKVVFERVDKGVWKLIEGSAWIAKMFYDEIEGWD